MIVKSRLVKRFVEPVLGDGLHLPCFHSPLFLLSSSTDSHFYSFPLLVIPILLLLSNSLNRHNHSLTHTHTQMLAHTHTHTHKLTYHPQTFTNAQMHKLAHTQAHTHSHAHARKQSYLTANTLLTLASSHFH